MDKIEECSSVETTKSCPKQIVDNAKPSSVPVKQDYIHVRARRGQVTNRHSLEDRVWFPLFDEIFDLHFVYQRLTILTLPTRRN